MIEITFTVLGDPVPWERASSNGNRRFTAPRTRAQEKLVADAAKAAGAVPFAGPVRLTVRAYRATKRRCDWDNLGKLVSDALNGICWEDDSQVEDARVLKFLDRDNPRTEVDVAPMVQPNAEQVRRELRSILGPKPLEKLNRRRMVSSVRRYAP